MTYSLEAEAEFKRAVLAEYKTLSIQLCEARSTLHRNDKRLHAVIEVMIVYGLQESLVNEVAA